MVRKLEEIQLDVCHWSKSNFGAQESKAYPDLVLGSLAPLLGMVEEIGEFFESEVEDDIRDAIADLGIFLCDYAGREGFILPEPVQVLWKADNWPDELKTLDAIVGLVVHVGKLCHITLKRHQGIRGFDDRTKYEQTRNEIVERIIFFCTEYFEDEYQDDWLTEVSDTWDKIVAKRNWKTNPQG